MTHVPRALLSVGARLRGLCALLPACACLAGSVQPAGTTAGAVQFDGVIELNLPLNGSHVVLFARYWVAPGYYRVAVAWAEPAKGEGLSFSVYPPSLSLGSDEKSFGLSHDIYTVYDTSCAKPVGPRAVFDYMYGDYAIPNLRFADQEAAASRVRVSDLAALASSPQRPAGTFTTRFPADRGGATSDLDSLRVTNRGGAISSLELLGPENRLLKRVSCEYEGQSTPPRLRRLTAWLPEQPVPLSLRDQGIGIKMGGSDFRFKEFQGRLRPGGRTAVVEYAPVTLGGKIVQLPARVEVRGGSDQALLRLARFINFRPVNLSPDQIRLAAAEYGGLPAAYRRFTGLAGRCQQAPNHATPAADAAALRELRAQFEGPGGGNRESPGPRLRRLSVLLEADRLLKDDRGLEENYGQYLSTLADAGLPQMLLLGGYGLAASAALRGDPGAGDRLLRLWVDQARPLGREAVLQFAEAELEKGEPWPALVLLDGIKGPPTASAGLSFEWAAARCLAARGVQALLSPENQSLTGFPKAQADLARVRTSPEELDRLLPQRLAEALNRLREAGNLTARQEVLRDRLSPTASTPATLSPSPPGLRAPAH